MLYEIIDENDEVENTIVASLEFVENNYPGRYREKVEESTSEPLEDRHITRLAFLSRFTDEEAVTIDLASIGATVEAASMRRYMSKVNAANFIDLSREDTRAGVIALESAGLLGVGRALEILDVPIAPHEFAQ